MKFVPKSICLKLKEICKDDTFRGIGADKQLDDLAATLKKSNRPADVLDALLPLEEGLRSHGHHEQATVISTIQGALMTPEDC